MFDLPSYDSVEEVVINREVVEGRAQPLLIYSDRLERRQLVGILRSGRLNGRAIVLTLPG